MRSDIVELIETINSKRKGFLDLAKNLVESIKTINNADAKYETCPDNDCNVSFMIEVSTVGSSKTVLVAEISKLGRYARVYWKKKGMLLTSYLTDPPNESHKRLLKSISDILKKYDIELLSKDELDEEVPQMMNVHGPDDGARVEDLLFAHEYH